MINFLNHLRQSTLILLGLIMVSGIVMLDYVTGTALTFSIFYFFPIILVSWYVGRRCGLIFALLSTCAWSAADYFGRDEYQISAVFLFNTGVRLGIFLTIAVLIARLRDSSDKLLEEKAKKEMLLENFVSLVKHELRNTAGSVKLMLDILAQEELTKEQRELVRDIDEENDRMEETVSTLSLLGKESDVLEEEYDKVSLNELNAQITQRLNTKQKVTITTKADDACEVTSSRKILAHILENVISNAVKYSPEHGTVTIELHKEKEGISFLCRDTGIGIPDTEQQYLFDAFFRASNAKDREGTGVGLFVAKQLLEKIGGHITVMSKVGNGTEVGIFFPYGN